jgi:hypothetical protein
LLHTQRESRSSWVQAVAAGAASEGDDGNSAEPEPFYVAVDRALGHSEVGGELGWMDALAVGGVEPLDQRLSTSVREFIESTPKGSSGSSVAA